MKLGIIGAGQLARMLAIAAHPLGIDCHCLAQMPDESAASVATLWVGHERWRDFCQAVDVITLENENVDLDFAAALHNIKPLRPGLKVLEFAQDRLLEKQAFVAAHIPVTPFHPVDSFAQLQRGVELLGLPCILKTRRGGYDGKGQYRLLRADDSERAWQLLGGQSLILEAFVNFTTELSIIAVRGIHRDVVFYPLTQNWHREGILRISRAPVPQHMQCYQEIAQDYAQRLLEVTDYVGVLAIELFLTEHGLLANECAPRVHNTGHWTIEGAQTSQFENHVRAVCGLPLGLTDLLQPSVMINCLGSMPTAESILSISGAHYHDYQKPPRPGRKVGHITLAGTGLSMAEVKRLTAIDIE